MIFTSQQEALLLEMREKYAPLGYYVMLGYEIDNPNPKLIFWTDKRGKHPTHIEHEFKDNICLRCGMSYEIDGDIKTYFMRHTGNYPKVREFDSCVLPIEVIHTPRYKERK